VFEDTEIQRVIRETFGDKKTCRGDLLVLKKFPMMSTSSIYVGQRLD
jgi:hypothetical protein